MRRGSAGSTSRDRPVSGSFSRASRESDHTRLPKIASGYESPTKPSTIKPDPLLPDRVKKRLSYKTENEISKASCFPTDSPYNRAAASVSQRLESGRKFEAEQARQTEISRGKAKFNGGRGSLPSIGHTPGKVYYDSVPFIDEHQIKPANNAVDIIERNEPRVKVTARMKRVSQNYINAVSSSWHESANPNHAPEVIARNEDRVGRAYGGKYDAKTGSKAPSRCSSGRSRKN